MIYNLHRRAEMVEGRRDSSDRTPRRHAGLGMRYRNEWVHSAHGSHVSDPAKEMSAACSTTLACMDFSVTYEAFTTAALRRTACCPVPIFVEIKAVITTPHCVLASCTMTHIVKGSFHSRLFGR
jgi:hypothetical protein